MEEEADEEGGPEAKKLQFKDFYLEIRSHFSANHLDFEGFKAHETLEEKLKYDPNFFL